jgi:hypothetical protein
MALEKRGNFVRYDERGTQWGDKSPEVLHQAPLLFQRSTTDDKDQLLFPYSDFSFIAMARYGRCG